MTLARRYNHKTQFSVDYAGRTYEVSGIVNRFLLSRGISIHDADQQTNQILYRHAFRTSPNLEGMGIDDATERIDQLYELLKLELENEILAYLVNQGAAP